MFDLALKLVERTLECKRPLLVAFEYRLRLPQRL
jgi:hypothetical protein